MSRLATKLRTARALGARNLLRVLSYRLGVRSGAHPVRRLSPRAVAGPYFGATALPPVAAEPAADWRSEGRLFGYHPFALAEGGPDWLADPISGNGFPHAERPWWQIPDFDPAVGDIKRIWELSRLDWLLALAQRARNGDADSLATLNRWLDDWVARNPSYCGPNWKCGQEASLRVMHLAMAAVILGQTGTAAPGVLDLVSAHLARIAPTISYAMAQDNNHGTSEAAGLFIGGSWLRLAGRPEGARYERTGRALLEERVGRLVEPDGSFSQYSLVYHRVLLDTLSMAELWCTRNGIEPFSARFQDRARAATDWLRTMTVSGKGDGPNLGANDGARLLQLTPTDYRDFRPSVQLAAALFHGKRAYGPGAHDGALAWLGVTCPDEMLPAPASRLFDDGGYAALRVGDAFAMLRYPRFRFRPSQSDALHLDFWLGDENLLRDGGSYSYNSGAEWIAYFSGVRSHNTVEFSGEDQMPRLGRFLFGDWLTTEVRGPLAATADEASFGASYVDRKGRRHERQVALDRQRLVVIDTISGFSGEAVLRWRLAPGDWRLDGTAAVLGRHRLVVSADIPSSRVDLAVGQLSRYYLQKEELPVLEARVDGPCTIRSEYRWDA